MTLLDRMVLAVERVRDRLVRATAALESAGIPYALVGGNAVAAWVATIDPAAVRNTQDVDILLRRADVDRATVALEAIGFIRATAFGVDLFLDGPDAKARDAVHILHAGEKLRADYVEPTPDVADSERPGEGKVQIISLEALVKMKLTANRDKDRTHLRDMLDVGLIDKTWPPRLAPELAARLQNLIDTPGG